MFNISSQENGSEGEAVSGWWKTRFYEINSVGLDVVTWGALKELRLLHALSDQNLELENLSGASIYYLDDLHQTCEPLFELKWLSCR